MSPKQTTINFHLDTKSHAVDGDFQLIKGEILFDLNTGSASGLIVIDAVSAKTGKQKLDKKMHKKVLQSPTFPLIEFLPEAITGELVEGEFRPLSLRGKIKIHGASQPLLLVAKVRLDEAEVFARTTLEIPYVLWGMKDPSIPFLPVEKIVEVRINLVGRISR